MSPLTNSQADRLGDNLREGKINRSAIEQLNEFRASFAPAYAKVEGILAHRLNCKVTGRPSKSTIAIVEKLKREKARLTQIQDVAGCRVIVHSLQDQDELAKRITYWLPDTKTEDRRVHPSHGYRALHLIPRVAGRRVEVQIRTFYQHVWAEISEKIADIYGQEVKYGGGAPGLQRFLTSLSEVTKKIDANYSAKLRVQDGSVIVRAGRSKNAQVAKREIKALNAAHKANIKEANLLLNEFLKST